MNNKCILVFLHSRHCSLRRINTFSDIGSSQVRICPHGVFLRDLVLLHTIGNNHCQENRSEKNIFTLRVSCEDHSIRITGGFAQKRIITLWRKIMYSPFKYGAPRFLVRFMLALSWPLDYRWKKFSSSRYWRFVINPFSATHIMK